MKKPKESTDGILVQGERFIQFVSAETMENPNWVQEHLLPILNRQDADITMAQVDEAVKAALK